MATTYTQDQINAAYAAERANGASDADLARVGAERFGVTADQFAQASQSYGGAPSGGQFAWAPSPSPAPSGGGLIANAVAGSAPSPAPAPSGYAGGRALTADEIAMGRQWSTGKSSTEAYNEAQKQGLTAAQFGQLYGWTGDDSKAGGYGNAQGLDPQYARMTFDGDKWVGDTKKLPTGSGFSSAGVAPWTVDRNQTVQGQAYDVIDKDSPLMQQARARAMQQMNERGLVNSSFAVQAGQDAVMDRALQIATPDAATYANSAQFNANATNTANMFNAGQSNQYSLADRELAQKQAQFDRTQTQNQSQFDATLNQKDSQFNRTQTQADAQFAQNLALQYKQLDTNKEVSLASGQNSLAAAGISASTQRDIAAMNNEFKLATMGADKAAASTSAFNSKYDNFITKVTNITMDKDLSSEAKNNMINSEVGVIKGWATMNGIVGDLSYLDTYATGSKSGGTTPAATPAPATAPAGTGDSGGE